MKANYMKALARMVGTGTAREHRLREHRREKLMDRSLHDADPSVGLCSVCAHSRVTGNRRGSIFWLCRRSTDDARYRRYPRLPVARCAGFEPSPTTRSNLKEQG